ncbi:hypothetical protein SteCoe_8850 [Stentor coeruleus]|uniref:Uncharacterized protein n=1 Tax=Stentor coeruleus TaxID=5963 RepID=A0A1R2CJ60_9CILI|nr:hypothetical protein SteCoe_8850 [Stentor coeruleus]
MLDVINMYIINTVSEESYFLAEQNSTTTDSQLDISEITGTKFILLACCGFSLIITLISIYYEIKYQLERKFYKSCLNEVIDAPPNLNPLYEGKLIFLVGKIHLSSPCYLSDPLMPFFDITKWILLKRNVEMLQWYKNNKNIYEKKWCEKPIFNYNKQYANPIWCEKFKDEIFLDDSDVNVLPFKLCREAVKMLPVGGSKEAVLMNNNEQADGYKVSADPSYYYLSQKDTYNNNGGLELDVGDYRVKYYFLEVGTYVTVLGEYKNGVIEKYKNKLLFVDSGFVSINTIFERYISEARYKQNQIRAVGIIWFFVGIIMAASTI